MKDCKYKLNKVNNDTLDYEIRVIHPEKIKLFGISST